MLPKKANEVIPKTALETGVSEELVDDIVSYYWAEVRKCLVDMKADQINVIGLGIFRIKHWKIEDTREKYKAYLTRYQKLADEHKLNFQQFAIQKEIETRLAKLDNMLLMVEKNKLKKQSIKLKRNELDSKLNQENQDNIQEQE